MRFIVLHLRGQFLVFGSDESHLGHQLAAVADSEAQGVLAGVETLDGSAGFLVVEQRTGPAFGGAQGIGIGESSDEDYHLYVLQGLTARYEVGDVYVLYCKSGHVQSPGHLTVAVGAGLADDGRLDSALGRHGVPPVKVLRESEGQRLFLVIDVSLGCRLLSGLYAVEQPGGAVPAVSHGVYVQSQFLSGCTVEDPQSASLCRTAYLIGFYLSEIAQELLLARVLDLYDHSRDFGQQHVG